MKDAGGHGSDKGRPHAKRPLAERFWLKVNRRGAKDCWPWRGFLDRHGYGQFMVGPPRASKRAHRVAYELLVGPIPEGMTLDHFRMNPGPRHAPCSRACVNPRHLEPVPLDENKRRGNSPHATNARKTHCPRGHQYDYFPGRGGRQCRACRRLAQSTGGQ